MAVSTKYSMLFTLLLRNFTSSLFLLFFTLYLHTVNWEIFVLNFFTCNLFVLKYFCGSWQPTNIKRMKLY